MKFRFYLSDIDAVIQKFGKKKLKGCAVTAECVKVTNCILVQGLKPQTSEDVIELYFENDRKSGGGVVMDVTYYAEENKATVTFEDWTGKCDFYFCNIFSFDCRYHLVFILVFIAYCSPYVKSDCYTL